MQFWLRALLRFAVSGGIIVWVVAQTDMAGLGERLSDASPWRLVIVFCLFVLQACLTAWRWRRVNRRLGVDLPPVWHIRHFLISLFFGQALPAVVGGDVIRAWYLGSACGSASTAINSVIVDRAIGLVALLLLTAVSLPFFVSHPLVSEKNLGIVPVVGVGVSGLVLLLMFAGRLTWLERFRWTRPAMAALQVFRALCLDPRESILQCLIGLAVHLSSILAFVLLAWALHISLPVFAAIAILPTVILLACLPVSVAGWGIREGSMVAGFSLLGLPASDGLILSVAFGLGEFGVGLIGGAVWLAAGGRGSSAKLPSLWSRPAAIDPPP